MVVTLIASQENLFMTNISITCNMILRKYPAIVFPGALAMYLNSFGFLAKILRPKMLKPKIPKPKIRKLETAFPMYPNPKYTESQMNHGQNIRNTQSFIIHSPKIREIKHFKVETTKPIENIKSL